MNGKQESYKEYLEKRMKESLASSPYYYSWIGRMNSRAWDVYVNNRWVDTVWYSTSIHIRDVLDDVRNVRGYGSNAIVRLIRHAYEFGDEAPKLQAAGENYFLPFHGRSWRDVQEFRRTYRILYYHLSPNVEEYRYLDYQQTSVVQLTLWPEDWL